MNDAFDILGVKPQQPSADDYDAKTSFETKAKLIKSIDSEKKKQDKMYNNKVREEAAKQVSIPVRKWRFFKFAQEDRDDDLRIYHWRRKEECDDRSYAFTSLNIPIRVFSYSDQEYETIIHPLEWDVSDPWNKSETDYLFHLCKHFDLIFPIIYDRYNNKTPLIEILNGNQVEIRGSKTLEQLKRRYFFIARALLKHRSFENTELIAPHPVMKAPFMYDKESKRMERLSRYYKRLRGIDREEVSIKSSLKHIQSILDRQAAEEKALQQKKTPKKKKKRKTIKKAKDVKPETLQKEAYYRDLALSFNFQDALQPVLKPGVRTRSEMILSTKLRYKHALRKKNTLVDRLALTYDLPFFGSISKPCFTEVYHEKTTSLLHKLHYIDILKDSMIPRVERDLDYYKQQWELLHPHTPLPKPPLLVKDEPLDDRRPVKKLKT